MHNLSLKTSIGDLVISEEDGHIVRVRWSGERHGAQTPLLREASEQIAAYFRGELTRFDLPLCPDGGGFQRSVCDAMSAIPFGQTRTYGELAQALGACAQAIGQACGNNSIPIVIPCHRVLGASGLGGFSGGEGLETKMQLLRHEGAFPYLL
jgi:methylated-DNA-[protein]-cysteine S-methyltransferase